MPKITQAHRDARREQILSAAFDCFSRRGFHLTTIQDICDEAELSPGAVYLYFDSKDAIIEGLVAAGKVQKTLMMRGLGEASTAPERLAALVDEVGRGLADPDCDRGVRVDISVWAAALSNERLMAATKEAHDHFVAEVAGLVRDGQAAGAFVRSLPPESVARVLVSVLVGLALQGTLAGPLDVDADIATVKALLARLGGDAGGE